ncbi:hypothetical protein TNCV_18051 [Trichonephila clavipes]|nr:hypothetical protein TNCV_18051 [Trichonephila clavipes]
MLQGKRFSSNEKVIAEVEAYFDSKDKSFYKKRIKKLEERWANCITLEGDLHAEIVKVEIEVVSPSIVPSGNFTDLKNRSVTCMVLKANDRRTSCPCHDEFRGPRSDYVRQNTWTRPTKSCNTYGRPIFENKCMSHVHKCMTAKKLTQDFSAVARRRLSEKTLYARWTAMAVHHLAFLYGSVTAQRYKDEVLEPHGKLLQAVIGQGFIFRYDTARSHRLVKDFLEEEEDICRMEWSVNTPDLNFIKNI